MFCGTTGFLFRRRLRRKRGKCKNGCSFSDELREGCIHFVSILQDILRET